MIMTPGLAEQMPLPPFSPLRTCADASRIECFCKGRIVPQTGAVQVGFASNPFDASGSSYLGCNAIGQVQVYWCPVNAVFSEKTGGCAAVTGTVVLPPPGMLCGMIELLMVLRSNNNTHTGLKDWQCVPGHTEALRKDPSGPLQCYSQNMRTCANVCLPATVASHVYTPPMHGGALTCGLVLQAVAGLQGGGLTTPGHWCTYPLP